MLQNVSNYTIKYLTSDDTWRIDVIEYILEPRNMQRVKNNIILFQIYFWLTEFDDLLEQIDYSLCKRMHLKDV